MSKKNQNTHDITGSEIVEDSEQRQYHIALAPGEVSNTVLLVGDPKRAEKVAKYFDSITLTKSNREFITYTGVYKNLPITVMSTGIGPSNVEISVIELSRIFNENETPVIIRIGSSGALQEKISVGDLVISTGAVRLEDTSTNFVDQSFPAIADYEVVTALITAAQRKNFRFHVGITATASGFYGAQGRDLEKFPVKDPQLPDKLAKRNVQNFEMESSTLFTLSSLANLKAGTVCAVYANRSHKTFIDEQGKNDAEQKTIQCGLEAALIIRKMDSIKKAKKNTHWTADMSL